MTTINLETASTDDLDQWQAFLMETLNGVDSGRIGIGEWGYELFIRLNQDAIKEQDKRLIDG